MVEFANEAAMERLAMGMMSCSLAKEEWTHAAHFAATLWLMERRPEMRLEVEMPGLIRRFNASLGGENTDTAGYHETITQASLRAARAFLVARSGMALEEVGRELMGSRLGKSDWLMEYWTRERLFSVEARRGWVEPDLKGLEF
ncbi:MAG: hypothetical protein V4555_00565 [Acidobacteriota bacterium]